MDDELEYQITKEFDGIVHQLTKGNSIQGLKNNLRYFEFEQIIEWKLKYGYQLHIYSNDHFIKNKPHFHLLNKSKEIDCRIFFNGEVFDCKGNLQLDRKIKEAVSYFLSVPNNLNKMIKLWNDKNPELPI